MSAAGATMSLSIDGPAGRIEAVFDPATPDPPGQPQPAVAIVCHPLSTEGGSLHNKVVTMTARALRECGVSTLRFNFRGVGASDGAFDNGDGELEDLRAVAAWLRARHPGDTLWLAGFSFGAWVSLRATAGLRPGLLLSIAPPVDRRWDFATVEPPECPWLVIQGEQDEIVQPQAVYDWVASLESPPELVRIPDAGHFFHRKLMDLRGAVKNGVRPWLPAPHG